MSALARVLSRYVHVHAHDTARYVLGQSVRYVLMRANFTDGYVTFTHSLLQPELAYFDVAHFTQSPAARNRDGRGRVTLYGNTTRYAKILQH